MKDVYEAIIEIPMGTKNKFEVDKNSGKIKLDRVLYSSVVYPGEYGYIDNTLSLDGDALDILIISSEATFPGCIVDARILGYLTVPLIETILSCPRTVPKIIICPLPDILNSNVPLLVPSYVITQFSNLQSDAP